MSSVHRTLPSPVLTFDLDDEMRIVRSELDAGQSRIARALIQEGPLRHALIGVRGGDRPHEYVTEGPVTIHALEGEIIVRADGETRTLPVGGLMALDSGVRHDVSSNQGGVFLLTLVARETARG